MSLTQKLVILWHSLVLPSLPQEDFCPCLKFRPGGSQSLPEGAVVCLHHSLWRRTYGKMRQVIKRFCKRWLHLALGFGSCCIFFLTLYHFCLTQNYALGGRKIKRNKNWNLDWVYYGKIILIVWLKIIKHITIFWYAVYTNRLDNVIVLSLVLYRKNKLAETWLWCLQTEPHKS